MKSLDDVIKALEMCTANNSVCFIGCPYSDLVKGDDCCDIHAIPAMQTDALHYLKVLKAKSEEPPLGEPPDYIPLDFHRLAEMIGEPVYFKERGCKGHWEIVTAVRKTVDGEDVAIRGSNSWQRIGNHIYRTKEGAEE